MTQLPYWLDFARPTYRHLERATAADIAIIGGGIAGLKVADALLARGASVAVVDSARIGGGASSRNQGCIVAGSGPSHAELTAREGRETAVEHSRLIAFNRTLLAEQIDRYHIECACEVNGAFHLVRIDRTGWQQQLEHYAHECRLLHRDGFRVKSVDVQAAFDATGNRKLAGGIYYPPGRSIPSWALRDRPRARGGGSRRG